MKRQKGGYPWIRPGFSVSGLTGNLESTNQNSSQVLSTARCIPDIGREAGPPKGAFVYPSVSLSILLLSYLFCLLLPPDDSHGDRD